MRTGLSSLRYAGGLAAPTLFFLATCASAASLTEFRRHWLWTVPGQVLGEGGLAVADLDGDGRDEILVSADTGPDYYWGERGRWYALRHTDRLDQIWSSFPQAGALHGIRAIESAGARWVLVGNDSSIDVFDRFDDEPHHVVQLATESLSSFDVADLDLDGQPEIVAIDTDDLWVYDLETAELEIVKYGFGGLDLAVGQLDADPQLEVAIAGNDFGGFALDSISWNVDFAELGGFGETVRFVQADGDPEDELLVAPGNSAWLQALDPGTLSVLWQYGSDPVRTFEVADLDGDGFEEVAASFADYSPELVVLSGTSGESLWSVEPRGQVNRIAFGNSDDDPATELVLADSGSDYSDEAGPFVVDGATHEYEAHQVRAASVAPGAQVIDVDADGRLDVVAFATDGGGYDDPGRAMFFDLDQQRRTYLGPQLQFDSYLGTVSSSHAANLDQDPAAEVCFSIDGFDSGRLYCEDGLTHENQYVLTLPQYSVAQEMLDAELDGGGFPELLVGIGSGLAAFEGESGWLKWKTPAAAGGFGAFDVGNVDAESQVEIVGSTEYSSGPSIVDGASGSLEHGPWNLSDSAVALIQADGDPELEVVIGTYWGKVYPVTVQTGTLGPEVADFVDPIWALQQFDVTRDGVPDLVAFTESGLQVWGGNEQQVLWHGPYLGEFPGYGHLLSIGDFDGNSVPELFVTIESGFALFDSPLISVFSDGFESGDQTAWD